jgi:methylated-DNA-[protein]-cysteine S-methyltransferase
LVVPFICESLQDHGASCRLHRGDKMRAGIGINGEEAMLSGQKDGTVSPAWSCLFTTQFGACGLIWSQTGLLRLQLPLRDEAETEKKLRAWPALPWQAALPPPIAATLDALTAYFAGEAHDFSMCPLDMRGLSSFEQQVYAALRMIGWGHSTTYGALAKHIATPDAARAVGVAMARNPWPIIVPCHRVLGAAGKIGGFSAYGGPETKRRLLRLEGIPVTEETPLLPGLFD